MAASNRNAFTLTHVDRIVHQVDFYSINAGEEFDYSYPSNLPAVNPWKVEFTTIVPGSGGDPVLGMWVDNYVPGVANSSRVVGLKLDTVPGGDLTDAVVRVYIEWREAAYGGIS